jgi:molybdopterin biosynthesis enzyme
MRHTGVLAADVRQSARRLKWVGCKLVFDDGGRAVLEPLGSNRLGTIYRADAIARIPEGEGKVAAGDAVSFLTLLNPS